jgi:hypothetical protein
MQNFKFAEILSKKYKNLHLNILTAIGSFNNQ